MKTTHPRSAPFGLLLFASAFLMVTALTSCICQEAAQKRKPTASVEQGKYAKQVTSLARRLVDEEWTVGLAVGLVNGAQTEVYTFGRVEVGKAASPTGSTLFEIGSVTKTFTAVLLAEMARRGQVKLDEPVKALLPDGVKVPARGGKQITLAQLSTHRSGLPRLPDNFKPANAKNPYADYGVDKMYAFLSSHELRRDPGEKYEYSNLAVGLLGQALRERARKMSYETLLREVVLAPLGMKDTAIKLTPEQQTRFARGHHGETVTPPWDIPAMAGAGGLRSSVEDMLLYVRANLGQVDTPLAQALATTHVKREEASKGNSMGLGWHINRDDVIWHNGGTGGFHSYVGFHKGSGTGVVVLGNTNTGVVDALGNALSLMLRGKPYSLKLPATVAVSAAVLERYVGLYEMAPGTYFTITRKGSRLSAQLTGQPAFRIYPQSETRFLYRVVKAAISFKEIKGGKAAALVLRQGGKDHPARRVARKTKRKLPAQVEVATEVLDRYLGTYLLAPDVTVTVTRRGQQLLSQVTGQPAVPIYPRSQTRFFYKVVAAEIAFMVDTGGKTQSLVLFQGGRETPAKKVK